MEQITSLAAPPETSSYVPLAEHQEATPASFFAGPPVLYAHFERLDALVNPRDAVPYADVFSSLWSSLSTTSSEANGVNGTSSNPTTTEEAEPEDHIAALALTSGITAHIGSDALIISSPTSTSSRKALRIPYPSIGLHATQRVRRVAGGKYTTITGNADGSEVSALYLQLDPSAHLRSTIDVDDEDFSGGPVDLLLISTGENAQQDTQEIFDALSQCADLHPDPEQEDSGDEGAAPGFAIGGGMPGEGGWITSDNAHEFADRFADAEEGVNGEGEALGQGAGQVREREDDDDAESKWQRTG